MNLTYKHAAVAIAAASILSTVPAIAGTPAGTYKQINISSSVPGLAKHTDPAIINPWGLFIGEDGGMIVAQNGTGSLAALTASGRSRLRSVLVPLPLVDAGPSAPTGLAFNQNSSDSTFPITDGTNTRGARFAVVTEQGLIAGYNPELNPLQSYTVVDRSAAGAIYKGATFGSDDSGNYLYAANFHDGVVEMYGSDWQFIRSFTDSNLPAGYAPFNVRAIEDRLFVTFAMQDDSKSDEVAGPGLGYVDMFDMQGNLLRSFASQGTLNAPWGVALASKKFGLLSNALLVGNFGDGRISAYDFTMGTYLGQMIDATTGVAIQIEGLWDLRVKTDRLYFTAGINSEADGLVGLIKQ